VAVDTAEKARALSEQLAINPLDPKELVKAFGLIGVWVILFAETGLLVGFFFPGDSLLFLAGVAASPVADAIVGTSVSLVGLLIGAPICAIAGAQLGHYLGARYGRRMFDRPDSRLFKREYVDKAEFYFNKYGPAKAVVLARFIPIVRTFLNPVAGTLGMPARKFFVWNTVGAILWCDGIILAGYLLAEQITKVIEPEEIDKYLLPVVALIVLISVLPIVIEIFRDRRHRRAAAEALHAGRDELGWATTDVIEKINNDVRHARRHPTPGGSPGPADSHRQRGDG
jgi:membrane-associated protein